MKSSGKPRAHYRDRHISLNQLPAQSTEHGFRSRLKKTSNDDLRRQARQRPVIGVFSLDGSDQGQEHDDFAPMDANSQSKKSRGRPRAATASRPSSSAKSLPLQVNIGPTAPANKHAKTVAATPYPVIQGGPLSPSYNSDDTPVSATNPYQSHFQNPYQMVTGNEFAQHFVGGGTHTMGLPGPASHNGFAPFDPQYQVPLTDVNPYEVGLIPGAYSTQVPCAADGSIPNQSVYYVQEDAEEYCTARLFYDPHPQLGQPGGPVVPAANYAESTSYSHGNGQYHFHTTNFGQ